MLANNGKRECARILSIGQFFLILIKISHIKWTNRNGLEFILSCKSDSTWVVSRYYATIASHTRNFYNKHRIIHKEVFAAASKNE